MLLLDTHLAFWWQTGDPRITEEVRRPVKAADEVFVTASAHAAKQLDLRALRGG